MVNRICDWIVVWWGITDYRPFVSLMARSRDIRDFVWAFVPIPWHPPRCQSKWSNVKTETRFRFSHWVDTPHALLQAESGADVYRRKLIWVWTMVILKPWTGFPVAYIFETWTKRQPWDKNPSRPRLNPMGWWPDTFCPPCPPEEAVDEVVSPHWHEINVLFVPAPPEAEKMGNEVWSLISSILLTKLPFFD